MSIYPPEQSKMNVKLLIVMKKEDKWRTRDSSFAPAFDDDFNTSHPNCLSSIWAPIPPWRTSGPNWDSSLVTDSGLWSSLGWDIAEPQRSAWCGGGGNIDRMKTEGVVRYQRTSCSWLGYVLFGAAAERGVQ